MANSKKVSPKTTTKSLEKTPVSKKITTKVAHKVEHKHTKAVESVAKKSESTVAKKVPTQISFDKPDSKNSFAKNLSETIQKINQTSQKSSKSSKKRSLISSILSSLVGENKEIARYQKVVDKIVALEESFAKLSDDDLRNKTVEFRARFIGLKNKAEKEKKLKEILPEAFAAVREASFRAIKQKHYPVQLIGGIALHEGRIAEMRTGEGKTLVSTLSGYLNALPEENQVHLVTVNDYLARRDASWMGRIYDFLGLSVGVIQNQSSFYFKLGAQSDKASDKKRSAGLVDSLEDGELQDDRAVLDVENLIPCERKRAYFDDEKKQPIDIVYGVNSEFGFDYLRDNMATSPSEITQKGHYVAIVDEVDSILIDEARTPLIISSQDEESSSLYRQFASLVTKLNKDIDYEVDEKRRVVTLTDLGVEKVERYLGISSFYESAENVVLIHHLDQALKAKELFKREKEYVVKDGEIMIVDEGTGRIMFGRRYSQGLHQALEAKENIQVQSESKTSASITFQNYFRLYEKLSGMTGTAATESEEFFKIYKLLVVTIPTNRPTQRTDYVDKIFKSEIGKFKAIVKDVAKIHSTGQPVLIGTTSIEKNLQLSSMLKEAGIPHQILNAKNHEQEARIISEAGKKGTVTLATNIAGRGIDIKLGGELSEDEDFEAWKKDHEEVVSLGGLYVIGTERHESRRIDNQLRGRSGRQGDKGESQFYISLEDFILRVFGGDRIGYYSILPIEEDQAIQNKQLSWLIEQAQKKIEGQNFDIRKHVTDYDDVINRQRTVIYARRKQVLLNENFVWDKEIFKGIYREVTQIVASVPAKNTKKQPNTEYIQQASEGLKEITSLNEFEPESLAALFKKERYNTKKLAIKITDKLKEAVEKKWQSLADYEKSGMVRFSFLRSIDILWTEHLVTIEHLQDAVKLRGYSQKDPLTEFKEEGLKIFMKLLKEIDKEIGKTIFKVTPSIVPSEILETSK